MDKYENHDVTDEQWERIQPQLPPEMLWGITVERSGGSFQNVMAHGKVFIPGLLNGGCMHRTNSPICTGI